MLDLGPAFGSHGACLFFKKTLPVRQQHICFADEKTDGEFTLAFNRL